MVKVKGIYIAILSVLYILLVSVDPVMLRPFFSYKVILLYLIMLSLYPFTVKDVKTDKNKAFFGAAFFISLFPLTISHYILFFRVEAQRDTGALILLAGMIFMFLAALYFRYDEEKSGISGIKTESAMVLFLLAVSLFCRLYMINKVPLGIWFDEAQNGNEINKILNENSFEVFIPRFTQMPGMFFWIGAFFVKVLGPEIFSLRLISIITGSLSVVAMYFLAKEIFGDALIAFAAAFLMAVSRWHIIFSRVAFLGMITVLTGILFFYFYLRMLRTRNTLYGILCGITAGISVYAFSGANLVPVIALVHFIVISFKEGAAFFRRHLMNGLIAAVVFFIIAAPLISYGIKNYDEFTRRIRDVSITKEIKQENSLMPVLKNIRAHLLMFSYHGDYNGRHNLYKNPMIDGISGVLLAAAFPIALVSSKYWLLVIWFFGMLSAGIMTNTIESPQAYRIIGILPALYLIIGALLSKLYSLLMSFKTGERNVLIAGAVLLACISGVNIHEYFVLYPEEKASYMDFSPEANGIARFINENSGRYAILVSPAQNMYGFYYWEQRKILEFATYKKGRFKYLRDQNRVPLDVTSGMLGAAVILRPSDTEWIGRMKTEYPGAVEEKFVNHFNDEVMYICYYIDNDKIKTGDKYFIHR